MSDGPDDFDDIDYQRLVGWAGILLGQSAASLVDGSTQYYGLFNVPILGTAYRLVADDDPKKPAYQQKCKDALAALAQNTGPVATDAHNSSMRLFVLALGFDLCFDTIDVPPGDPAYPADRQALVSEMLGYLDPTLEARFDWRCREFPPYKSNGSVLVGSATGITSIVLRGETIDTAWLDNALAWAERVVEADLGSIFDPEGGANEGELYGPFALRFLVPYVEARRRYDGFDLGVRPELRSLDRWMAFAVLPNGYATQANDGNYTEQGMTWNDTYTSWSQTRYTSQPSRWVFEQLAPRYPTSQRDWLSSILWNRGPSTTPLAALLPDSYLAHRRGFYAYRTGFTLPVPGEPTDAVFTFYAGRFGGGHAQEDQGTFSLYADGRWYLPDYGVSTAPYLSTKESEAHNLVFIDGRGEHNTGSLIGTDAQITDSTLGVFADYLQADLVTAYSTHSPLNDPGVPWAGIDWSWGYENPPNTVVQADRHVLVVKRSPESQAYFTVIDDINKDGSPHRYDWTLHTELDDRITTETNPLVITPPANPGHSLQIFFANPPFATLSVATARYLRHASDPDTQRITAGASGVVNPGFFVTIVPCASPAEVPVQEALATSGGLGTRLAWATASDEILFRNGPADLQEGDVTSDARLVLVRRPGSGEITKFAMEQGRYLRAGDLDLVTITHGKGSVATDGTTISLDDPNPCYTVWGPHVTVVEAQRQPVPFEREGPYIYISSRPTQAIPRSAVQAARIASKSMLITWETPFPADGRVLYGGNPNYGLCTPRDTTLATVHAIRIRCLRMDKTYHFKVVSDGPDGHAISGDLTFNTFGVVLASATSGSARAQSAGLQPARPVMTPAPEGGDADRELVSVDCPPTDVDPVDAAGRLGVLAAPNPARGGTTFVLPGFGFARAARLTVYDAAGRKVVELPVTLRGATPQVRWDGKTARGSAAPPGVYYVRATASGRTSTARFTLLR